LVQTYQNFKIIPNDHKLPEIIQNGQKIFQMITKYNKHFPFQGPTKCTHIGIFGMKINRLATLLGTAQHL
jgi:hypothetical protein